MRRSTPAAEVQINAALVRALLEDQHPDLAHLPLVPVGSGWDNALFRLGDSLAVRLPRRARAAPLILHEQRWLGELAPRLPLPIPAAIRTGFPGRGYPWSWSVIPWFAGAPVGDGPALGDAGARTLGRFLGALHAPAPENAPRNAFRSGPLAARTARVHDHVHDLDGFIDPATVLQCWEGLAAGAPWSGKPVWLHGDLHQSNVLVSGGQVVAIVDFGDITAGDPAVDLAGAWMLFTPESRVTFREAYGESAGSIDDGTWNRARGWALALNLAWLVRGADDESLTRQTLKTINAVLADTHRLG